MTRGAAIDEAQLYTVRVWCHGGQWRAVVRAVGDEHATLFTEPAPLAAWFAQTASPADARDGRPTPPTLEQPDPEKRP